MKNIMYTVPILLSLLVFPSHCMEEKKCDEIISNNESQKIIEFRSKYKSKTIFEYDLEDLCLLLPLLYRLKHENRIVFSIKNIFFVQESKFVQGKRTLQEFVETIAQSVINNNGSESVQFQRYFIDQWYSLIQGLLKEYDSKGLFTTIMEWANYPLKMNEQLYRNKLYFGVYASVILIHYYRDESNNHFRQTLKELKSCNMLDHPDYQRLYHELITICEENPRVNYSKVVKGSSVRTTHSTIGDQKSLRETTLISKVYSTAQMLTTLSIGVTATAASCMPLFYMNDVLKMGGLISAGGAISQLLYSLKKKIQSYELCKSQWMPNKRIAIGTACALAIGAGVTYNPAIINYVKDFLNKKEVYL